MEDKVAKDAIAANTAKAGFPGFGLEAGTAMEGGTWSLLVNLINGSKDAIALNTAKTGFPGFGTTAGTALEGNTWSVIMNAIPSLDGYATTTWVKDAIATIDFSPFSCVAGYAGPGCVYSDAVTCSGNGAAAADGTCTCSGGCSGSSCASCSTIGLSFLSTVSAVFNQGGGLPAGIAVDDAVSFQLVIDADKTGAASFPSSWACDPFVTQCTVKAWTFPSVEYKLIYSSGHVQTGVVNRAEIMDGGQSEFGGADDKIWFSDGNTKIYEVINFGGTFQNNGVAAGFATAINNIGQPGLFKITHYWGNWGNWATYHYDYTKPQNSTIVVVN
ncbi:MAG TPA: hypothetical protein EYN66_10910 [Myxococcales bacterium]|nr:hypothetical protein [Myxococcales bacterium]